MGFGRLSKAQLQAIKPYVKDCEVHDLGAGDLEVSKKLVGLGASNVVAVDREINFRQGKRISKVAASFEEFAADHPGSLSTSLISWPVNWKVSGLVELVARSEVVLYLGSNSSGSACGFCELWEHLSKRTVIEYVPERENTLIIYGRDTLERENLPEEWAALNQEEMWSFESLHARKAS